MVQIVPQSYNDTWTDRGLQAHRSFSGFVEFARKKMQEQIQHGSMVEAEKDQVRKKIDEKFRVMYKHFSEMHDQVEEKLREAMSS